MYRNAIFNKKRTHRYALVRRWKRNLPVLIWIMLNPSDANELKDDPTIRVCIGRARRLGYGGIIVINLFPHITSKPKELVDLLSNGGDDLLFNMDRIRSIFETARVRDRVIAAWGTNGTLRNMDRQMIRYITKREQRSLWVVGLTKDGHPRHPLRVSYATRLQKWYRAGGEPVMQERS